MSEENTQVNTQANDGDVSLKDTQDTNTDAPEGGSEDFEYVDTEDIDIYKPNYDSDSKNDKGEFEVDPNLDLDEETQKGVAQLTQKELLKTEQAYKARENNLRVDTFLADPERRRLYGDGESKVRELLQKDVKVSDLSIEALFRLATPNLARKIVKTQQAIEKDANNSKTNIEKAPRQNPEMPSNIDWTKATPEQFQKAREKLLNREGFEGVKRFT